MSEVAEGSNAAAFDVRPGDVLRLCTAVLPVKPPVDTMSYYVRARERESECVCVCACSATGSVGCGGVEVFVHAPQSQRGARADLLAPY